MSRPPIQVLKFGSSVLPSAEHLHIAVHEIYRHLRDGKKVIAVTSAIGDTTDRLLHQAGVIADQQNDEAIAELLATGETEAVALLKLALAKAGLPAHALTARCLNLQTEGPLLDSYPVSLDPAPLWKRLELRPVLVVPGFVGCQSDSRLSLLGRGGSDLTALVIANALQNSSGGCPGTADRRPSFATAGHSLLNQADVSCRLLKDVPGLFQWDPAADGPPPRRYRKIGFDEALDIGGVVLQPKAVQYAQQSQLPFELGQCGSALTTDVGAEESILASSPEIGPAQGNADGNTATTTPTAPTAQITAKSKRLRVALLGLGTVGCGVYHYLAKHSDKFEIVDLVAANPRKPRPLQPPLEQLSSLANPLRIERQPNLQQPVDVIVELAGSAAGFAPHLLDALAQGTAVVTADKEFVAKYQQQLAPYRNPQPSQQVKVGATGGQFSPKLLRCSAAVAGVVPALECAARLAAGVGVSKLQGVLNGTTNFILQQIAAGNLYADALRQAQELGFAEADPSADVYGWDAARKLSLLIEQAWGVQLPAERIPCHGIATLPAEQVHANVRLVAEAQQHLDGRVSASVKPVSLADHHPLLAAEGVGNVVVFEDHAGGHHLIGGDGAGKWPTAEAVFADLLDLWREQVERNAADQSTNPSQSCQVRQEVVA
jgi:homoserine dehydrogenase